MERVDHIDIVQVGGGRLVGHIDRMLQRNAPDGEGLELGVPSLESPTVFLIQLAEANSHLAAARSGGRDHHQGAAGLHIVVLAKALFRVDEIDIGGIALYGIVVIDTDTQTFQTLAVGRGAGLAVAVRDDHRTHIQSATLEHLAQAQHILIVGDADVAAHLVLLNVDGTDDNDDFGIVFQLHQHPQLAVGLETRQHPAGVEIVEKLASKLQIELVPEFRNALFDVFGLDFKVLVVVETYFHFFAFKIRGANI